MNLILNGDEPLIGYKRGSSQFASSGGWEFTYYPQSGDSASIRTRVNCHRSAASRDCVSVSILPQAIRSFLLGRTPDKLADGSNRTCLLSRRAGQLRSSCQFQTDCSVSSVSRIFS